MFHSNAFSYNYVCPVYGGGIFEFECVGIDASTNVTKNHTYNMDLLTKYPVDSVTLG